MVAVTIDDSGTLYELDHRWVPESIFHYSTSGSVERQEGTTETFFYGDKRPEAMPIVLTYSRIFRNTTELMQFASVMSSISGTVVTFVYGAWETEITKCFFTWAFGSSMNEIDAKLVLIPTDNDSWIGEIIMSRSDIFLNRTDIFMNTLRGE